MVAAQVEMAKKALVQKLAAATTPKLPRVAKVSKYPGARLRQLRAERGVGRPVYQFWTLVDPTGLTVEKVNLGLQALEYLMNTTT